MSLGKNSSKLGPRNHWRETRKKRTKIIWSTFWNEWSHFHWWFKHALNWEIRCSTTTWAHLIVFWLWRLVWLPWER